MKKSIIYVRASTNEELQASSFSNQELAIQRFSESNGYEITDTYKEYVSASKKASRPEWKLALERIELDPSLYLIVYDVARATRSLRDWALIEPVLNQIRFVVLGDETPNLMVLATLIAYSQTESEMISMRVKSGIERKKHDLIANGKEWRWGGAHKITSEERKHGPLANVEYAKDKHVEVLNALRDQRGLLTLSQKADYLNKLRIRTRRGKLWTIHNLHRVLKREK